MFDKFSATVKSPPARCQPKRCNALFAGEPMPLAIATGWQ